MVFIVSYWVIPGGYDYHNAYLEEEEFSSKEEADAAAERIGESPPEMAVVFEREEASHARR